MINIYCWIKCIDMEGDFVDKSVGSGRVDITTYTRRFFMGAAILKCQDIVY